MLPVLSLIEPMMIGARKPPKFPIELIRAIPPAAARPDSTAEGIVQNSPSTVKIPVVAIVMITTVEKRFDAANGKHKNAAAPTKPQSATCQRRSAIRSELRPINIIPTAAIPDIKPLKSPVWVIDPAPTDFSKVGHHVEIEVRAK